MLLKLKHKISEINKRIEELKDLFKTAYSISKNLNSRLLKLEFIQSFTEQTNGSLNMIFLGLMINAISANNKDLAILYLIGILSTMFISGLIRNYINYKNDIYFIYRDLETTKFLIKKIALIPVKYRSTVEFKEIERNADVRKAFNFFSDIIDLLSLIYGTILVFLALSFIQPTILIIAVTIGLISTYLDSKSKIKGFEKRKELSYFQMLNESFLGNFKLKTIEKLNDNVRINNNLLFLEKKYNNYSNKFRDWYQIYNREVSGTRFISQTLLNFATAFSLGITYMYGINGLIPIGNLIILGTAYKNLVSSIGFVGSNIGRIFQNFLNVKAIDDLINFPIPVVAYKPIDNLNNIQIEFDNVSFSYPGTDKKVLDGVSFKISKGDKLGIIGENGAGKSTIIKLLFRIYAPTQGTILVNGTDINDISDQDFYNVFSILSQDSIPEEALSIEDIISLGDTSHPKNTKKVIESAKLSTINRDIKDLEDGYKQYVADKDKVSVINKYSKEKFTSLSGGQFRKLLLAKVFYAQKPIVVLDEPTDSIDPHSAYTIFKNLNNLKNNQIVLFITHDIQRMQLVANKILTLKDGKVVEFDETKKLAKRKDSYFSSALETYIKTIRE